MLFIIAWLIAMATSELLLWSYGYLHLISPILYISLSIMFIYQRRKIYKNKDHNFYEKKIAAMRSGIMFVVAMLVMLAITVNIRFFTLIYTGL
jgi:amino acid permease